MTNAAAAATPQSQSPGKPGNGNPPPPPPPPAAGSTSTSITRLQALQQDFERYKPALKDLLPPHIKVDRVIRIATKLYFDKPELAECTTKSMVKATVQCAELGLDPSPLLGEAAFIAYDNTKKEKDGGVIVQRKVKEVQLMPMYRGLIKLARNSGEVADVYAVVVDESEKDAVFDRDGNLIAGFYVEEGTERRIRHIRRTIGRKNVLFAVYAVVKYKDDTNHFEVLDRADIERYRAFSKAKDKGPWVDNYDAMAKKTAIKQALKTAPMSPERLDLAKALALDNAAEAGKQILNLDDEAAIETTGEDVSDGLTAAQEAAGQSATRSRASELDAKLGNVEHDRDGVIP